MYVAVCEAPVHQSGDPGRERRAREEPTGAGTNSERAHQRAQVQVRRTNVQKSQQNQAEYAWMAPQTQRHACFMGDFIIPEMLKEMLK